MSAKKSGGGEGVVGEIVNSAQVIWVGGGKRARVLPVWRSGGFLKEIARNAKRVSFSFNFFSLVNPWQKKEKKNSLKRSLYFYLVG